MMMFTKNTTYRALHYNVRSLKHGAFLLPSRINCNGGKISYRVDDVRREVKLE
jgi:hypothetical protein